MDKIIKIECHQVMVIITIILLDLLELDRTIECLFVQVTMDRIHIIRDSIICECLVMEMATGIRCQISVVNRGSHLIEVCRCQIHTCLLKEYRIPKTFRNEVIGDLQMKE